MNYSPPSPQVVSQWVNCLILPKINEWDNQDTVVWLVTVETISSLKLDLEEGFGLPLRILWHSIHAECIRLQHGRYSGTKMIEIINNFLSLPWPFKPTLVCCLQFLLFLLFPSSIAGFLHFYGGGKCQVHKFHNLGWWRCWWCRRLQVLVSVQKFAQKKSDC